MYRTILLLRTAQAAAYLAVSTQVLAAWRRREVGPAYVRLRYVPLRGRGRWEGKKGGMIGYPVDGLEEFIERYKVQAGRLPRPRPGRLPLGRRGSVREPATGGKDRV